MSSNRILEDFKHLEETNTWSQVYTRLGHMSTQYPYTCNDSKLTPNKPLNRYRDVNPFDHTRVVLLRGDSDYINANHVEVEQADRKYILTQGPLVYTVGHFWTMVWEQEAHVIVMLNKLVEKGERKCHLYWPNSNSKSDDLNLSDYFLHVALTSEKRYKSYTVRKFKLTETAKKEERVITQYHYTTWPDFEVPASPVVFLKFLKHVRGAGAFENNKPVIVHCSAGIGRSGTFCLVDTILVLIEKEGHANIDVRQVLMEMRKYRMGLIQTSEQLRFSYMTILEGIRRMAPDFEESQDEEEEEDDYAAVPKEKEEEEVPPPPPPRGASLGEPPARPLPAIPGSISLENLDPIIVLSSDEEEAGPVAISSSDEEEEEDNDASVLIINERENVTASLDKAGLRKRRIEDLAVRLAKIKKRSHEADRWHSVKRSLIKPLALSVGFILAGILIYAYIKH